MYKNIALILAGGSGSRMKGADVPKQYMEAGGRPVIGYCLQTFQETEEITDLIITAEPEWYSFLEEWIRREKIEKFRGFAGPGRTRQHSVYNGLKKAMELSETEADVVIIHDAARPCVSGRIIKECIVGARRMDAAMPVIPVKDTVYRSADGKMVTGLLNRDELFAGQSPEGFKLRNYYEANRAMDDKAMGLVRGSSEPAYRAGMRIGLIEGEEGNFKITTREDMERFRVYLNGRAE